MKKLVLVMICALVMVLFIALNYLLWDRENKMNIDARKDINIATLGREVSNLEAANASLKEKVSKLEAGAKTLEQKNEELQQEKNKTTGALAQKNEIINQLKQMIDTKGFEAVITKWADCIDKGQYDQAYQLQLSQLSNQQNMTFEEFTNYYKTHIKNIKVTAIKLNIQGAPEDKKGDITFKVSLEVKRVPNSGKAIFEEGNSDKLFTLVFLKEKNIWVIGEIQ